MGGCRVQHLGPVLLHVPPRRDVLRFIHPGQMLQDILGLRKMWNHGALEPLWLARWWRCLWRRLGLAHSSRLAPELLLSCSPHRLLLLWPPQGALLQRLRALRGLHHSLPVILAVLTKVSPIGAF